MRRLCFRLSSLFGLTAFCIGICLTFSSSPLPAQSTYGSVTGSVTDPSGAPITGTQVTLTNLGTSEKRIQTTGDDGLYLFPNLLPGLYRIEVEKAGFNKYARPEVRVEVNQTSRIDVSLQIGNVSQVVEVTAETPGESVNSPGVHQLNRPTH